MGECEFSIAFLLVKRDKEIEFTDISEIFKLIRKKHTKMKHLFVPYEIALQLKKKGFDEPCLAIYRDRLNDFGVTLISNGIKIAQSSNTLYYDSNEEMICLAPLYQQVIDWLKLEKRILVAERWEGWKYGDFNWGWFIYCETKEEAITEALKLI